MKKTIIFLIVIILVGIGVYYFINNSTNTSLVTNNDIEQVSTTTEDLTKVSTTTEDKTKTIIGESALGKDIIAYHYGTGTKEILFVGGIHGGYEWNTSLLAFEAMDYLKGQTLPSNIKVTVIPVLNPDGLSKVVGTSGNFSKADVSTSESVVVSGRFNGNNVDLNRNFDCDWQANAKWQNKNVSGGDSAFSEPEAQAIKNYVEKNKPVAVIVWYSAAGGVYSSSCHNGILSETKALTNTYAKASGYPAYEEFNFYEITGDMVNWFAKEKIPAISVLLTTHDDIEWIKNKAGIDSILKYYAK
jgi:hypothetical protein